MTKHKIEWLNRPGYKGETWNPIIGCSHKSAGCDNCYAERMANRQVFMRPGCEYCGVVTDTGWNGKTALVESALTKPLHWKAPLQIFVCSMGDLFHESVSYVWIDKVFAIAALCPQHTFLILTKRPDIMREYFVRLESTKIESCAGPGLKHPFFFFRGEMTELQRDWLYHTSPPWPLPNVWLGTSIEDQATADERIPHLLKCPAPVRFISGEPLLGPIDLWKKYIPGAEPFLDWVIAGGESGPGARPMHPDWVRSLRDQCAAAAVPFMFKQWGEWLPGEAAGGGKTYYLRCDNNQIYTSNGCRKRQNFGTHPDRYSGDLITLRIGRAAAGHHLDGREHLEYPEVTI